MVHAWSMVNGVNALSAIVRIPKIRCPQSTQTSVHVGMHSTLSGNRTNDNSSPLHSASPSHLHITQTPKSKDNTNTNISNHDHQQQPTQSPRARSLHPPRRSRSMRQDHSSIPPREASHFAFIGNSCLQISRPDHSR